MVADLNYSAVGATEIDAPVWSSVPPGFRAHERSVDIGNGESTWQAARAAVMTWGVETRSGFEVHAADGSGSHVREAADYTLEAQRWYPFRYLRALRGA